MKDTMNPANQVRDPEAAGFEAMRREAADAGIPQGGSLPADSGLARLIGADLAPAFPSSATPVVPDEVVKALQSLMRAAVAAGAKADDPGLELAHDRLLLSIGAALDGAA